MGRSNFRFDCWAITSIHLALAGEELSFSHVKLPVSLKALAFSQHCLQSHPTQPCKSTKPTGYMGLILNVSAGGHIDGLVLASSLCSHSRMTEKLIMPSLDSTKVWYKPGKFGMGYASIFSAIGTSDCAIT